MFQKNNGERTSLTDRLQFWRTTLTALLQKISWDKVIRYFGYAFVAYLAFGVLITIRYLVSMTIYPGEVDYGEGVILHEIQVLKSGGLLYPTTSDLPFVAANYGPIYYLFAELVTPIAQNSFLPFRLLSFLGLTVCFLAGCYVVYLGTRSRIFAILGGCAVLFPPSMLLYGINAKPDSIALAMSLTGICFALRAQYAKKGIEVAGVLFALALCYKQSSLPAPIAVGIFLLWRDRRQLFRFAIAGFAAMTLILGLWGLRFGFTGFIEHFVFYNVAIFDANRAFIVEPYRQFIGLLPFIITAIVVQIYARQPLLTIYCIVSFLFHIPAAGKAGAYIHYFSEPMLSLFLIVLYGCAAALNRPTTDASTLKKMVRLSLIIVVALIFKRYDPYAYKGRPDQNDIQRDATFMAALDTLVTSHGGKPRVIGGTTGHFPRLGDRVDLVIDDPFLYNQHIRNHKRSDETLLDELRKGKIDIITLNFPANEANKAKRQYLERINPDQASAIDARYTLVGKYPGTPYTPEMYYIYIPRGTAYAR
ncbi:MAG: glycosyltransferase family 39 protein [Spirochaetia bacterium]|nr:glycosyltransferase family 39 protein [Spirochaetia bacterium]